MDAVQFVAVVRQVVRNGAVADVIHNLEAPPGRRPAAELVADSTWYKTLDQSQRKRLANVLNEAVDHALFGFFCVLDGVRAIESGEHRGRIELRYMSESDEVTVLNQEPEMLHDIYNSYDS
ncbi:MAG: hypothetical protein ABR987_10880 [Terracidiphilus sp.]|jgi:hypothetical protein